jgi:uncharacterized protein (TIGR03067 family)
MARKRSGRLLCNELATSLYNPAPADQLGFGTEKVMRGKTNSVPFFGGLAMRWLALSWIFVALLCTTACSGQRSPEGSAGAATTTLAKKDLEKLQGTWRIQSSIWNGVEEPEIAKTVTILFQDDQFVVIDRDGNRRQDRIQLMPDQSPKAIDCWTKEGRGQPSLGIYSLGGDTFKWCSAAGDKKVRPTSFDSKPGSRQSLMVLRREKG